MRLILTLLAASLLMAAQENPSWSRPFPPHKIADNLFYVGTEDLACFLITTPEGHILINTGLAGSTPLIRDSMTKLGYKMEDIRILLNMQAHFDHVAAMEEVRKISGAKVYATEADAPIMEDGGKSDPHFGAGARFTPVKVDRRIKHGDVIALGGVQLTVVATPGHSKGSVSYTMTATHKGVKRSVGIVNMATIVMPLKGNPKYPHIAQDLELTFANQKKLSPEIWVAAHASQYGLQEKLKRGSFVDPEGYRKAIAHYEAEFRKALAAAR